MNHPTLLFLSLSLSLPKPHPHFLIRCSTQKRFIIMSSWVRQNIIFLSRCSLFHRSLSCNVPLKLGARGKHDNPPGTQDTERQEANQSNGNRNNNLTR